MSICHSIVQGFIYNIYNVDHPGFIYYDHGKCCTDQIIVMDKTSSVIDIIKISRYFCSVNTVTLSLIVLTRTRAGHAEKFKLQFPLCRDTTNGHTEQQHVTHCRCDAMTPTFSLP